MARRGTPLPFDQRRMIQDFRRARETIREIARKLGLSVNTVRKYEGKFDTKPLQERRDIV